MSHQITKKAPEPDTVLTIKKLASLVDAPVSPNLVSIHAGLVAYGTQAGLDKPHRLVSYLAQLGHESGQFRYDREIWGPTPAQRRYDTRTDLGNTKDVDGDGYLYRGRTAIQITGKTNTTAFRDWCRTFVHSGCPDFVELPDLMNTDPWEGLAPIWYWTTHDLNRWADVGDQSGVTRAINGGQNGLEDRLRRYVETALTLLYYSRGAEGVRQFQRDHQLKSDGIPGPRTRDALHVALTKQRPLILRLPHTPA